MNKEVVLYDFNGTDIRVLMDKNNEPWFVGKDITDILSLNRNNLYNIPDKYKAINSIDSPGGKQKTTMVSEPGLYQLIFKSRKKEAVKFQEWVFEDVLPSIRKYGEYRLQRENIKPGYKEIASNVFLLANGDKSVKTKTLQWIANLINKSIIGMTARECKEKYNLSPRDYVLKYKPKKLDEFDSLQHVVNMSLENGINPLQIKKLLKQMGLKHI